MDGNHAETDHDGENRDKTGSDTELLNSIPKEFLL